MDPTRFPPQVISMRWFQRYADKDSKLPTDD
jgi:hypothetical protein